MKFEELRDKWARNINAEYIVPTLDAFHRSNYIIPKDLPKDEQLGQLKLIKKHIECESNYIISKELPKDEQLRQLKLIKKRIKSN